MRYNIIFALMMVFAICSCDDNTVGLGTDIMPDADNMNISTSEYNVTTRSIASGPVLAKTSMSYLGRYTDPETNTAITADFIAQFHCLDGFALPEKMVDTTATKTELRFYFNGYMGDTLNACKVEIYPLNKIIDNNGNYYTDIDASQYYDASQKPIATLSYTVRDHLQTDSTLASSSYEPNVSVRLPNEIGTRILREYYRDQSQFENSASFIKNICKGFYVKFKSGDGTILNIDAAQFNIYFDYYEDSSTGKLDSIVSGISCFGATEEVIQATNFSNSNIDKLVADNSCTYVKSPAGIFTEVTLPVNQLSSTDTINSAKIVFTRYNNENYTSTEVAIPQKLLMIRKTKMKEFFENGSVTDSVSSYIATFNSTYNSYTFSNIAQLLSSIRAEEIAGIGNMGAEAWIAANPDWDKVVLIPVTLTYDSNGNTVAINNDLSIGSVRLIGGDDKLKMKVIYSKFANFSDYDF